MNAVEYIELAEGLLYLRDELSALRDGAGAMTEEGVKVWIDMDKWIRAGWT